MAEVIYPDVNSLWDALTADWGAAGSYGELVEAYSAARAAYLDRIQYHVIKETWFSAPDDIIALTQAASDDDLPGVVLPNLAGRTIDRVYVGFAIGFIENTDAGANALTAGINVRIKTTGGAWGVDDVVAIALPNNSLMTGGDEKRAGVVFIGELDVSGEVDIFNETYVMRLEDCTVDNDNLNLYDCQTFLTVVYH